mmetsp:Transcript_9589/g.39134  ORF Transcript_9589/g.39134 Transcript_9589/m.39134 type:complete len:276 (+) Transcript_9589:205-1032(+)
MRRIDALSQLEGSRSKALQTSQNSREQRRGLADASVGPRQVPFVGPLGRRCHVDVRTPPVQIQTRAALLPVGVRRAVARAALPVEDTIRVPVEMADPVVVGLRPEGGPDGVVLVLRARRDHRRINTGGSAPVSARCPRGRSGSDAVAPPSAVEEFVPLGATSRGRCRGRKRGRNRAPREESFECGVDSIAERDELGAQLGALGRQLVLEGAQEPRDLGRRRGRWQHRRRGRVREGHGEARPQDPVPLLRRLEPVKVDEERVPEADGERENGRHPE